MLDFAVISPDTQRNIRAASFLGDDALYAHVAVTLAQRVVSMLGQTSGQAHMNSEQRIAHPDYAAVKGMPAALLELILGPTL
jgi:hypothetical protein